VASGKKAPALSAKMSFLGHFLTVFHPKKRGKKENFEKSFGMVRYIPHSDHLTT